MQQIRPLLAAAGVLAATVAAGLVTAGPADAQPAFGSLRLCQDVNGSGLCLYVAGGDSYPNLGNVAAAWNDNFSSAANGTDTAYCLYTDANYAGAHVEIKSFQVMDNLKEESINDKISSVRAGACS